MRAIVLVAIFLLSACAKPDTGLAPPAEMPVLPPTLAKKAERLPDITDPSLGNAHIQGAEDDAKYNSVAYQLNTLIDVYNCVRESLISKKDPEACFNASN